MILLTSLVLWCSEPLSPDFRGSPTPSLSACQREEAAQAFPNPPLVHGRTFSSDHYLKIGNSEFRYNMLPYSQNIGEHILVEVMFLSV